jgi:hypothetical protein
MVIQRIVREHLPNTGRQRLAKVVVATKSPGGMD